MNLRREPRCGVNGQSVGELQGMPNPVLGGKVGIQRHEPVQRWGGPRYCDKGEVCLSSVMLPVSCEFNSRANLA